MSDQPVSRRELHEQIEDVRLDTGVSLARVRQEIREEIKLVLGSFRNEQRVLLIGAVIVLKFDVPDTITIGALAMVGLKTLLAARSAT